jgi:hypothetical protein
MNYNNRPWESPIARKIGLRFEGGLLELVKFEIIWLSAWLPWIFFFVYLFLHQ